MRIIDNVLLTGNYPYSVFMVLGFLFQLDKSPESVIFEQNDKSMMNTRYYDINFYNSGERKITLIFHSNEERVEVIKYLVNNNFRVFNTNSGFLQDTPRLYYDPQKVTNSDFRFFSFPYKTQVRLYRKDLNKFLRLLKELPRFKMVWSVTYPRRHPKYVVK